MPTIKAREVDQRVRRLLNDPAANHWSYDETVAWLNDAQVAVFTVRPDASVTTAPQAAAGQARQSLPAAAIRLLDVVRNVDGPAISYVERADLDAVDPDWLSATGAAAIHYTYDERDPRTFYLYPAPTGSVEMLYTETPAPIPVEAIDGTGPDQVISIDDTYVNELVNYVCFRAYAKSTEAGNFQRAATYAAAFQQLLGVKLGVDRRADPDRNTGRAEQVEQLT